MEKCTNCQATLDPAWKFCIACGTAKPADAPAAAPTAAPAPPAQAPAPDLAPRPAQAPTPAAAPQPPHAPGIHPAVSPSPASAPTAPHQSAALASSPRGSVIIEDIPAAIRDSQEPAPKTARKLNVSLIVSISLGVAGAALIVYLVILVFGTRG